MRIVVAYIPTPQGEAALERALEEARAHGGELVVLNAARGEAPLESNRLYDDAAAELDARLNETGVRYTLRRELRPGDPAQNVLDAAHELGADMIVIGLRRRSPTGKLLFGSNAQRILLEAGCPVLAVKAPAEG